MLEFFEYIIRWIVIIPYLVMAASLIAALTPLLAGLLFTCPGISCPSQTLFACFED